MAILTLKWLNQKSASCSSRLALAVDGAQEFGFGKFAHDGLGSVGAAAFFFASSSPLAIFAASECSVDTFGGFARTHGEGGEFVESRQEFGIFRNPVGVKLQIEPLVEAPLLDFFGVAGAGAER